MATYPLDSHTIERAMLDGLEYHFRQALRKKFEDAARVVIDEAVAEGMKTFETSLKTYRDNWRASDIVEVILTDKRTSK